MNASQESLKLAEKLNLHNHGKAAQCQTCQRTAETIDADLQLPQRNAALLLAQTVVDEADRDIHLPICDTKSAIDELCQAIMAIKA